jgi:hypothetical protein
MQLQEAIADPEARHAKHPKDNIPACMHRTGISRSCRQTKDLNPNIVYIHYAINPFAYMHACMQHAKKPEAAAGIHRCVAKGGNVNERGDPAITKSTVSELRASKPCNDDETGSLVGPAAPLLLRWSLNTAASEWSVITFTVPERKKKRFIPTAKHSHYYDISNCLCTSIYMGAAGGGAVEKSSAIYTDCGHKSKQKQMIRRDS